jgi:osmotically-inducible protein OsmY
MKRFKSFLSLLIMVLVMGGCQALTGETLGENIDDTGITTRVKASLAADKGTTLTRVGVETTRGVVQLTGVVESAADRARAEQVTRTVNGVRGVVNNLQVQAR